MVLGSQQYRAEGTKISRMSPAHPPQSLPNDKHCSTCLIIATFEPACVGQAVSSHPDWYVLCSGFLSCLRQECSGCQSLGCTGSEARILRGGRRFLRTKDSCAVLAFKFRLCLSCPEVQKPPVRGCEFGAYVSPHSPSFCKNACFWDIGNLSVSAESRAALLHREPHAGLSSSQTRFCVWSWHLTGVARGSWLPTSRCVRQGLFHGAARTWLVQVHGTCHAFHSEANFPFLFIINYFLRTHLEILSISSPRWFGPLPCPWPESIRTLTFAGWWVLPVCDSFCISSLALHRNGAHSRHSIYLYW